MTEPVACGARLLRRCSEKPSSESRDYGEMKIVASRQLVGREIRLVFYFGKNMTWKSTHVVCVAISRGSIRAVLRLQHGFARKLCSWWRWKEPARGGYHKNCAGSSGAAAAAYLAWVA